MQVFSIEDKKNFMKELLCGEAFDKLLLSEARIEAKGHMLITGRPAEGFYNDDKVIDPSGCLPYADFRESVFSFIKGDITPKGFMVMLMLPRDEVEKLIKSSSTTIPATDVESLSVLIRFKDGALSVTTGTSIGGFYPDRSLEKALDEHIDKFIKNLNINYQKNL